MKIVAAVLAVGACMAAPAEAAPGVVVGGTDIFAGPSPDYPLVGSLPPGAPVEIYGCEPDWGWCDVAEGPYRGWAPASRLQILYNNAPGPLLTYGPMLGLPLFGFAFGSYWGAHYRGRPWYSDHDRWGHDRWGGGRPPPGPGFRGPEMRRPEMRGPEMRGPEMHGPEMRGPERGPEMHRPEMRGPEFHGPEFHGPAPHPGPQGGFHGGPPPGAFHGGPPPGAFHGGPPPGGGFHGGPPPGGFHGGPPGGGGHGGGEHGGGGHGEHHG
ncbi:SH3 domain-containing protein [Nguyenibacter vanlangensis]|uniref:SH3 domain-containing protein n=1 Tax=Nguyenibacter vanlangensis TaxID=1216886 RepID=A0ABZ3DAD8_9PROT